MSTSMSKTGHVGTHVVNVESFDELEGIDLPEDTVARRRTGGLLFKCSREHGWTSIDVEHLRAGQQRAYADSIYEYLVTFRGGTPSARKGWHLPFGIHTPYTSRLGDLKSGRLVIHDAHSHHETLEEAEEARWRAHDQRTKEIIKAFVHGWDTDSTTGEARVMGGTWLETFECISKTPISTTYRIVVKSMYMD